MEINIFLNIRDEKYEPLIKYLMRLTFPSPTYNIIYNDINKKPNLIIISKGICAHGFLTRVVRKWLKYNVPYIRWSKEITLPYSTLNENICSINHCNINNLKNLENILIKSNHLKKSSLYKTTKHFHIPLSLYRPLPLIDINELGVKNNTNRENNVVLITRGDPNNRREKIFKAIYNRFNGIGVHSLGKYKTTKGFDNVNGQWSDLDDVYSKYKFAIVSENSRYVEGGSEKLMNVYRGGCIPIYDELDHTKCEKDLIDTFYNSKSMINVKNYETFESLAEHIYDICNDDNKYNSLKNEKPIIKSLKNYDKMTIFCNEPSEYYKNMASYINEKVINGN